MYTEHSFKPLVGPSSCMLSNIVHQDAKMEFCCM